MGFKGHGGKGGPKDVDGLTPLQAAFVVEFLKDPTNASDAARRAGYKTGAEVRASECLANPAIKAKIAEHQARLQKSARKTLADIQAELEKLAFVNLRRMEGKSLAEMDEADSAAVLELTTTETYDESVEGKIKQTKGRKIRLADKRAALMDLAKLNGWVLDRSSIGGGADGNGPIPLETTVKFEFFKAGKKIK